MAVHDFYLDPLSLSSAPGVPDALSRPSEGKQGEGGQTAVGESMDSEDKAF